VRSSVLDRARAAGDAVTRIDLVATGRSGGGQGAIQLLVSVRKPPSESHQVGVEEWHSGRPRVRGFEGQNSLTDFATYLGKLKNLRVMSDTERRWTGLPANPRLRSEPLGAHTVGRLGLRPRVLQRVVLAEHHPGGTGAVGGGTTPEPVCCGG
jgi:hypothetical protein